MTRPDQVVVIDSSAVIALLTLEPVVADWVTGQVADSRLAAPELMPFETGNILRRHERAGLLDSSAASMAHRDLLELRVDRWPYTALGDRAWELRAYLTCYDASYPASPSCLTPRWSRSTAACPGSRPALPDRRISAGLTRPLPARMHADRSNGAICMHPTCQQSFAKLCWHVWLMSDHPSS